MGTHLNSSGWRAVFAVVGMSAALAACGGAEPAPIDSVKSAPLAAAEPADAGTADETTPDSAGGEDLPPGVVAPAFDGKGTPVAELPELFEFSVISIDDDPAHAHLIDVVRRAVIASDQLWTDPTAAEAELHAVSYDDVASFLMSPWFAISSEKNYEHMGASRHELSVVSASETEAVIKDCVNDHREYAYEVDTMTTIWYPPGDPRVDIGGNQPPHAIFYTLNGEDGMWRITKVTSPFKSGPDSEPPVCEHIDGGN